MADDSPIVAEVEHEGDSKRTHHSDSLLMLLDEVRGKTVRILRDMMDEESHWAPPGLHNHILWHAEHSFVLVESPVTEALPHLPSARIV